jgi:hypothetical protein
MQKISSGGLSKSLEEEFSEPTHGSLSHTLLEFGCSSKRHVDDLLKNSMTRTSMGVMIYVSLRLQRLDPITSSISVTDTEPWKRGYRTMFGFGSHLLSSSTCGRLIRFF